MKSVISILGLGLLLTACDIDNQMQNMAGNNPNAKPRMIAAQYGCMGCHTVDNSIMGPAWRLVAESYANDPQARATVIEHIKHGSRGRWESIAPGQVMPGFANRMSDSEVGIIADYILALNTPSDNI